MSIRAVAGQVDLTTIPVGLAPYTAISTDTTRPDFGLVVASSYDTHWPQFNSHRKGCDPTTPDACFNSPLCTGDTAASKTAVVSNWGSSNSGFWGSNSNSVIAQEVLDLIQVQQLTVGTNIEPVLTNGIKQSEASINYVLNVRLSGYKYTRVSPYIAGSYTGPQINVSVPLGIFN